MVRAKRPLNSNLDRMRAFQGIAGARNVSVLAGAALVCAVIAPAKMPSQEQEGLTGSRVSVYHLRSKVVDVVYRSNQIIEAPNWAPDGKSLLVNSRGSLYRLALGNNLPLANPPLPLQKISTGAVAFCNNDKGYSPNGTLIALSGSESGKGSQVFTVAPTGGSPKLIVSETPSYFHSFSPDAQWMAFVAQRDDNFDLFRVPTGGGAQERLTSNAGYDDGPDYSPDGKWIYFNSNRSGSWKIWRIPATGAGPNDQLAQQVTNDQLEDWFPHPSPDGKWLLFLSFPTGTANHNGHTEVKLRMIPLTQGNTVHQAIREMASLFGGQGTINVNSWSPDSLAFAFVSYEH
jgi:Tol biopolymer transport system component